MFRAGDKRAWIVVAAACLSAAVWYLGASDAGGSLRMWDKRVWIVVVACLSATLWYLRDCRVAAAPAEGQTYRRWSKGALCAAGAFLLGRAVCAWLDGTSLRTIFFPDISLLLAVALGAVFGLFLGVFIASIRRTASPLDERAWIVVAAGLGATLWHLSSSDTRGSFRVWDERVWIVVAASLSATLWYLRDCRAAAAPGESQKYTLWSKRALYAAGAFLFGRVVCAYFDGPPLKAFLSQIPAYY
jgi:hypothetical protein